MIDYKKISAEEVQKLAKQGDKTAVLEMVYRDAELLSEEDRNTRAKRNAWADYWFEKASSMGSVEAKFYYARAFQ